MTHSPFPWPAVIVAVDPGEKCGWCIWVHGKLAHHGTLNEDIEDVIFVLRTAADLALKHGLTLILVGEKWGAGGQKMTPIMAAGLGAGWGPWLYVAKSRAHQRLSDRYILRLNPRTWRTIVYGSSPNYSTEQWKRMARERVRAQFPQITTSSADECEAILIGFVATRFDKVGAALPAKVRKAMRATTSAPRPAKP